MRAIDWIGRVLVLVLSALATFSLIASLVSVPAPVPPEPSRRGEVEIKAEPTPQPPAGSVSEAAEPSVSGRMSTGAAEVAGVREMAKWLRALTYAVLGLAGFVAVLVIVAMRATAHLGAIADRR